jgi:hypothetical protein
MKTVYSSILFLSLFVSKILHAQNNELIIYSQEGIRFTVILNGLRQNMQPETNVRVTQLNAPSYQVKLIFANNKPDLNQTVYLMYGGDNTQNTEYTYALAVVKGKYKLKFKSAAPTNTSNATAANQQTVVIFNPSGTASNTVSGTTSTTTTTNVSGTPVGIGGNSNTGNINVNINGNTSTTTSTSTTTTTTTTTGVSAVTGNTSSYTLPGYSGIYGCPQPMSPSNFEAAKNTIKSKNFDESRLTIAKQIIGSNCLLCSQIKELMLLLSFESSRLELAKFAWHHTLDKGNYFMLNDAFTFESSITELNNYTKTH